MSTCIECGSTFECGVSSGYCWCFDFPALIGVDEQSECMCPDCLKNQINERALCYVAEIRSGKMKNIVPGLAEGSAKFIEGIDYYLENGAWVFTEWFHLKKGKCCGNGCRHCPYG